MVLAKKTTTMLAFTVPLSSQAHSIAKELSSFVSKSEQRKQVYLNTLTVFAVNFYLDCLGFETSLSDCESRDRVTIKLMDVADLEVKNLGKLECRYVIGDRQFCQIPPEVWSDRLGYVIVKLNDALSEAKILGFVRIPNERIYLDRLQPLEELISYLSSLEQKSESLAKIELRGWLEGIFESGWEDLRQVFNRDLREFAFREKVQIAKAKKINLGTDLSQTFLALVVKISSIPNEEELDIIMQLHPLDRNYLPQGLNFYVYEGEEKLVLQTTTRAKDNFIQLEFSAMPKEKFSTTIVLEDNQVCHTFVA